MMLPVRCAILLVGLLCAASVRAEGPARDSGFVSPRLQANHSIGPRSIGPRSHSPRRTTGYHDDAVEPATFVSVSDAKPILPESWSESEDENIAAPPIKDAIVATAPVKTAKTKRSGRRLRSSSQRASPQASTSQASQKVKNPLQQLLAWRPPSGAMTAAGSGLAIVVGLMFVSAWVVKKSLPRSARTLPTEVAEVLGRVQLAGKQTAQLLRIGPKLVLVAVTPDGAKAITEITDEAEVQRLLAACEQQGGHGSTAAFEQIFQQMAGEPAGPGFLGDEAPAFDPQRLASAYANTPGGRSYG